MIEWRKWDPENPPEPGKHYLIVKTTSIAPQVAAYYKDGDYGTRFWDRGGFAMNGVTHWAPINLPGEET